MPGARTTSGTNVCWSATSASTRRGTPSSACADTSSAGHAFISGWRRGRVARCVRSARPPSAGRRSSPSTAGETQNKRILEQRCHRGRPVSARSRRAGAGSRASASARDSTCHSASAPSPSASSHPPSTSVTHGLAQRRAARRSTRRSSSCRRYSCGWPSCSCCGSSSRDRPGWWAGGRCVRTARETSRPTCWAVERRVYWSLD